MCSLRTPSSGLICPTSFMQRPSDSQSNISYDSSSSKHHQGFVLEDPHFIKMFPEFSKTNYLSDLLLAEIHDFCDGCLSSNLFNGIAYQIYCYAKCRPWTYEFGNGWFLRQVFGILNEFYTSVLWHLLFRMARLRTHQRQFQSNFELILWLTQNLDCSLTLSAQENLLSSLSSPTVSVQAQFYCVQACLILLQMSFRPGYTIFQICYDFTSS